MTKVSNPLFHSSTPPWLYGLFSFTFSYPFDSSFSKFPNITVGCINHDWFPNNDISQIPKYHEWLSTRSPVIPNYISPNFKIISLLPANPTHPDKYSEHNKPSFYYEIMIPETSHFLNTNTRYSITTIILYIILTCNASLPLKLSVFFFS